MINDLLPPLTIESLVNGGSGLAHCDGRVVFIPHTAVGDVVRSRITKIKKTYLEAELCEIVNPSPQRQSQHCPVAGECGGCQWQHLPYEEQLVWKEKLFRETIVRQCDIDPARILPIVCSAKEWGYRSRVQIKCSYQHGQFVTGFFRVKSHTVVAVETCPLVAPALNDLLIELRQLLGQSPYRKHISQLDLAIGDRQKCNVIIHYSGEAFSHFAEFMCKHGISADVQFKIPSNRSLININGDGILQISVDQPELLLDYAAGSFAQINLEQNRRLVEKVLALADLSGSETVIDLFCGMGNFSLPLAKRAERVVGVETSSLSIKMAKANRMKNNIRNVTYYNRSAESALSYFAKKNTIDLLLLDPPRSGAIDVMNELVEQPVKEVIYVSCDPQTLARDLKVLVKGGYELVSSQSLDMFPQTYHCESVTLLRSDL